MPDFETTVHALRRWAEHMSDQTQAAVELLAWHEFWLRRADFRSAAIVNRGVHMAINWDNAREFFESGPRGSTSELAVLDLAIALGEDRYRIGVMGHAHRRSVANAVMIACGVARPAPSGEAGDGR